MMYDDIEDLRLYLGENVGIYCHIGMKDFDPKQYPLIQILPDQTMTITTFNTKSSSIDIPLTVKVIADRYAEKKVFYYAESVIKKINQYNDEKGHRLIQGEDITPEYTDNTYELTLPYVLKLIIQDS